jgi:hypothetical protein
MIWFEKTPLFSSQHLHLWSQPNLKTRNASLLVAAEVAKQPSLTIFCLRTAGRFRSRHACSTSCDFLSRTSSFKTLVSALSDLRPYLFIRESIFSRIRSLDNEFSRLETSVVFLDWTQEKLTEFVERRLVRPFNTKPPLGGEAWSCFFEDSATFDSRFEIFNSCENRPRDVLTYVSFALESAVSRAQRKITAADIKTAGERFSTSKLKDLADEFAENYPNIHLVIRLFYGLSTEYTLGAIENFLEKLLVDRKIAEFCKDWFFHNSTPHEFISLFYSIGFFGIKDQKQWVYKAPGGDASGMPSMSSHTTIQIHPAYHSALHLRQMLLPSISGDKGGGGPGSARLPAPPLHHVLRTPTRRP